MHRTNISEHEHHLRGPRRRYRFTRDSLTGATLALTALSVATAPALAQIAAQPPRGSAATVRVLPSLRDSTVQAPAVAKRARAASLKDTQLGRRALQLASAQEQAMAAVRARYSSGIKALIARLNALIEQQTTPEVVKATEDTLRHIIATERASLDSLLSPDQKRRFDDAIRRTHAEAAAPPAHNSPVNR